ncbi:unnamed protein product, partial [Meganyctiphanes norvegica]
MVHSKKQILFVSIVMVTFLTKCLYLKRDLSDIPIYSGCISSNQRSCKISQNNLLNYKLAKPAHFAEKRSCRSMFEIHKSAGQNWDKDEPYEALSENLPPLLIWPEDGGTSDGSSGKGSSSISGQSRDNLGIRTGNAIEDLEAHSSSKKLPTLLNDTRLQILNGRVPYLPCKIQYYSADDVGTCLLSRAAAGASTWVAFVGASKMREKLHQFLAMLPNNLIYAYFLEEVQ